MILPDYMMVLLKLSKVFDPRSSVRERRLRHCHGDVKQRLHLQRVQVQSKFIIVMFGVFLSDGVVTLADKIV